MLAAALDWTRRGYLGLGNAREVLTRRSIVSPNGGTMDARAAANDVDMMRDWLV